LATKKSSQSRLDNFHFTKDDKQRRRRRLRASPRRLVQASLTGLTALFGTLLIGVGAPLLSLLALFVLLLLVGKLLARIFPAVEADGDLPWLRLAGLSLAALAVSRLFLFLAWPTTLIPLPLFAGLASIAFGSAFAMTWGWLATAIVSVAVGMATDGKLLPDLPFLIGVGAASSAMTLLCSRLEDRAAVLRSGVVAGLFFVLAIVTVRVALDLPALQETQAEMKKASQRLSELESELARLALRGEAGERKARLLSQRQEAIRATWRGWIALLRGPFWGLVGCVFGAFLLFEILPWVEQVFGVVTPLRLRELADLNQPILKRMNIEAPGTYHHSQMVARLAESAAEAVGADPLLTRVGAYYHDIGKMAKPRYFTENNPRSPELHKQLSPTLSTLVIHAHVKDGEELGRSLGLPAQVLDFIHEHHGTTACEFFYREAVDEAKEKELSPPPKEVFRYPGPRPRSREAAIVMVADSVEAATRSLDEPSPARLRKLVHEIVLDKMLDHQFDDSPISISELARVEASLVEHLSWMYHSRVKYPDKVQTAEQKRLKEIDAKHQRAAD